MAQIIDRRQARLDDLLADIVSCEYRNHQCEGLKDLIPRQELNLWNCWQGDLYARLMVIGQDFGNAETQPISVEDMRQHIPWRAETDSRAVNLKQWCPTDRALRTLFSRVFGVDLTKPQKLFFTNMACCYREGKTSGEDKRLDRWLPCCANKHMGKLLRIIRPQAIIALGQRTLEALYYCEDAIIIRQNNEDVGSRLKEGQIGFSSTMNFDYTMTFSDDRSLRIAVFPVYHPEYYAHIKKGEAIQKQAWKRIAGRLNHLDDRILQELQAE